MGSINKRLENLEVRQPRRGSGSGATPNYLNRFLETMENERMVAAGLPPLEVAPYGPEDVEDDRLMLRKISDLSLGNGWPGNEGLLDLLEQDALDNLARYAERGDR